MGNDPDQCFTRIGEIGCIDKITVLHDFRWGKKKKRTVARPLRSCHCPDTNGVVCSSFSVLQEAKELLFADEGYADQLSPVGSFY